jgi:hypothetical protein
LTVGTVNLPKENAVKNDASKRKPSEIMKAAAAEVRESHEVDHDGPLGPVFRDPESGALAGGPMYTDPDFDFTIFDGKVGRMMGKGDYEDDCPTCQAFREMDRENGFDVD